MKVINRMSRIGIMSMQRIRNYGSFLQAYALKQLLIKQGHEVEFVDYHVGEPLIKTKQNRYGKVLDILKEDAPLIQKIQYIIYKKNFKQYYKDLELSNEYNYNPKLDALVIGSDEVFNCIQANKNVGYSLELFGKDNNAQKLVSYAASFGNTTIEKIEKYGKKEELANLLTKFNAISVRDENSKKIVKELTGKIGEVNLDPVLIYDYIGECTKIPEIDSNEKYMIVYAYSGRISKNESKTIKKYAKENNLKIYAIGGAQKCADKFINCSPFEVLSYFKKAELVITDTFHGSIFSVITHRKFLTLIRKSNGNSYGNEEKLTDLLERLSLTDRMTYKLENNIEKIISQDIDYNSVDTVIRNERKNTNEYLKRVLN